MKLWGTTGMSFWGRAAAMRCWVWGGLAAVAFSTTSGAGAFTLREAIATTIDSNPQIGAAVENREAIEFELRQARGLYMPRVDAETSVGARQLDQPFSSINRFNGPRDKQSLNPLEAGIVGTWKLFDGFATDAEVERQASRVDGASYRVLERSEFLALEVTR